MFRPRPILVSVISLLVAGALSFSGTASAELTGRAHGHGLDAFIGDAWHEFDAHVQETPHGCNCGHKLHHSYGGVNDYLASVNEPPGEPWCAAFISFLAQQAGIEPITFPDVNDGRGSAAVADLVAYAQSRPPLDGGWEPVGFGYRPQPGDLVVFTADDLAAGESIYTHVGLVVVSGALGFMTIEGNAGPIDDGKHDFYVYQGSYDWNALSKNPRKIVIGYIMLSHEPQFRSF